MANIHSPLKALKIIGPCGESWKKMTGGKEVRFCAHCRKTVHDLSAMTLDDAERLVCQAGGSLCVRFKRAADGQIITLDYQKRLPRNKWLWPITAAVALSAAIAGAIHLAKPQQSMVTVGNIGPLPPITTPAKQPGVTPGTTVYSSAQPAQKGH